MQISEEFDMCLMGDINLGSNGCLYSESAWHCLDYDGDCLFVTVMIMIIALGEYWSLPMLISGYTWSPHDI